MFSPRASVLLLLVLCSCSPADVLKKAATPTTPAPAVIRAEGPVGLFFMTRYNSFAGSLELATWYFSPDGHAYENPVGFSAEALAAHAERHGTFAIADGKLALTLPDGSIRSGSYELDEDGSSFIWDMGIFTPVRPFRSSDRLVGRWQGGVGGRGATASFTLELRADGTYARSGAASVSSSSSGSTATVGGWGPTGQGTWSLDGVVLTLKSEAGERVVLAFPLEDKDPSQRPARILVDGVSWTPLP